MNQKVLFIVFAVLLLRGTSVAQNPIIKTMFTPDPAPFVYGDTVYLFTDHDEDDAQYFKMKDWLLYSTTDMVNWTYRGAPISTETFKWAKQGDNAWASQAIERNGKWYWYICAEDTTTHLHGIGVAMAESPTGPYRDAIGKPLVPGDWGYIDPSVFIDDDGQAYLFWGNNGLWYARLNEDMISLGSDVIEVEGLENRDAFGKPVMKMDYKENRRKLKTGYEEGPWVTKRDGTYYLVYAAGGVPEFMAYSTSESIHGPWKYRGRIMDQAENSFTIHGGSIEFKGRNFMFYHNGTAPNGSGFRRSTAIEEFCYLPDGSIPFIPFTKTGVVTPVGNLNPYERVEAETMADCYGVKTDRRAGDEHSVTSIHNGDLLRLRSVDFGSEGATSLRVRTLNVRDTTSSIEFRADGKLLVSVPISGPGESVADVKERISGVHDLTILFRGGDGELLDFDWWKMEKAKPQSADRAYRNPIIYADVPDMSVCRAGDYYYMISTTMHLMPGAPIMRSTDMRNWETVSYVFPSIDDGPRYNLKNGTAYGQGQWASSIRHHDGKFYVWFTANGEPGRGFVYTADKAEGPWTLLSRPPHFHDGSLLFDDDGKVYMFHGTGRLTELKKDLSDRLPGGTEMQIFERDEDEQGLLEGSFAFKHDDKYYLMMISMDWSIPGRLRREVCYRADSIKGPYEKRIILETEFDGYGGVGQGCITDSKDGNWYGLIFQDRGAIGRVPCLMPCTWSSDGWPMLGDENGNIPTDNNIPYASLKGMLGSDDFAKPELSLYWQWNHNPIDSAWSLTEEPGKLRLKTTEISDNLYLAPNTLTQRMEGPKCSGYISIDTKGMKDGDVAGLAAFNSDSGVLAVRKTRKGKELVMSKQVSVFKEPEHDIERVDVTEYATVPLKQDKIYLRVDGDFTHGKDYATFFYSHDGEKWSKIGEPVKPVFDYQRLFMGAKFAIFNYATESTGGYVDIDEFVYSDEDHDPK